MIRLSTQTTQTIKFIPRQGVVECLVIENEATSETVELDLLEVVDVLGEELVVNGDFSDGLNDEVDYLVVADGVFSNTKQVIEKKKIKPVYSGAVAIRTQIRIRLIGTKASTKSL